MKGYVPLSLLIFLATSAALLTGQVDASPGVLWSGLVTGEGPGALILDTIRGPRVATALGAGAVLGMSGALFQMLFRNPLASPDILGFNAGAGLAIIAGIAFGIAMPTAVMAALGGVAMALVIGGLAFRGGGGTPVLTIILIGIGAGFTATAVSTFLMTILPGTTASEAQRWLTGSLAARDWSHAAQVLGIGAMLASLALRQARILSALELGDGLAAGLGQRPEAARWWLSATGVLLAATGVAVAGPVPFVALMAGPLGMRLTGARTSAGRMVSGAGAGALLLVLSDLLARVAVPGLQLPAGVATGLLGAPYLLWRLSREMERGDL
ncbi:MULTISPECIES: FecCD family ABC transporter permease [Roseovarius]|uniref:FecCD family ABC transporter permease n=1 Tax=Roseovarius TaxID=74030 RepID=UPI00273DBC4C|nr:iron ABC transporter permease [Roseovarius sp. MMSF_3448]